MANGWMCHGNPNHFTCWYSHPDGWIASRHNTICELGKPKFRISIAGDVVGYVDNLAEVA